MNIHRLGRVAATTFALFFFAVGANLAFATEPDVIPPAVPGSIVATVVPPLQVTVSWAAATDNVAVTGYYLYRNGTQITTINAVSFADIVPFAGVYSYTVAAYDAAGNVSGQSAAISKTVTLDNAPPSAPTNLAIAAVSTSTVSSTRLTLSWTASTDNVGVAGYRVYKNNSPATSTAVTSASYAETVVPGTYTYFVVAYDAAQNTAQSSPASITIITDNSSPGIPTNLLVQATSSPKAIISWASPSDNVGVKGYYLYRDSAQIANITATSYIDANLPPAGYIYAVAAYDFAGNVSNQSPPAAITIYEASTYPTSTPTSSAPTTTPNATTTASTTVAVTLPPVITPPPAGAATFTLPLYVGSKNTQVMSLQSILVARGYLTSDNATGFFGRLTEAAVRKFQCDKQIVCAGNGASTGWGLIGAKTRAALNALSSGSVPAPQPPANAAALQAQLLLLLQQLQALQARVGQ